jgi:hypothetical protein
MHGMDTAASGLATALEGRRIDSFTSRALQAAGLEHSSAETVDAVIGMVGSIGAGVAGVVFRGGSAVATNSVSMAFVPGVTRGGPIGHSLIRVTTAETSTQWSHLTFHGKTVAGIPLTGNAAVERKLTVHALHVVATVPVSAARAEAALVAAEAQIARFSAGRYALLLNDCATYTAGIAKEAGISMFPIRTPALNYLAVQAAIHGPAPAAAVAATASHVGMLLAAEASQPKEPLMSLEAPEPANASYETGAGALDAAPLDCSLVPTAEELTRQECLHPDYR